MRPACTPLAGCCKWVLVDALHATFIWLAWLCVPHAALSRPASGHCGQAGQHNTVSTLSRIESWTHSNNNHGLTLETRLQADANMAGP